MKLLQTLSIFSIFSFSLINSYSQCSTCSITDPVVLPNPIPAGTIICITTNKTYGGHVDLTGGAIHVCSGATLRLNGSVDISATSEITTTGCSRVEVHGNIENDNPTGLKVIDNCNCPNSITSTGPIFGYGVVCGPLPVELISFDANLKNGNEVVVSWATATEINNHYFTIERSTDLMDWELVTSVEGAGNSNQIRHYATTDVLSVVGTYYYRLTQTDYDGKSETFDYRTVTCHSIQAAVEVNVFPNPASEFVTIGFNGNIEQDLALELVDLSGKVISSAIIAKGSGREYKLTLDGLEKGIYLVKISGGSLNQSSKLIIG